MHEAALGKLLGTSGTSIFVPERAVSGFLSSCTVPNYRLSYGRIMHFKRLPQPYEGYGVAAEKKSLLRAIST
jgi:hypothetical protein